MKVSRPKMPVCVLAMIIIFLLERWHAEAQINESNTGTILYVRKGADGDCLSWHTACGLQTALGIAVKSDQIWVAAGTYLPTRGLDRSISFELKNGVALYGGFPEKGGNWESRDWETNTTTLSGDIGLGGVQTDNSYHVVSADGVDQSAILDGFIITAGYAADGTATEESGGGMYILSSNLVLENVTFTNNWADDYGGGMYNNDCSSLTLNDVTFTGNASTHCGGMLTLYSDPTLTNVTFSENEADVFGGGLCNWNSDSIISDAHFIDNLSSGSGGGMSNYSCNPTLSNVTFSNNRIMGSGAGMYNAESSPSLTNVIFSDNSAGSYGGGICNLENSQPILDNVTFSNNSAHFGGGIYNFLNSNPILENVTFYMNTSREAGGGMYNDGSNPTLTNVTFSDNISEIMGGGMYNDGSNPTLINTTFYGNTAWGWAGGIINWTSSPTITNSILWGNSPGQIINEDTASTPIVTYSDIEGGYEGIGNIDLNPLLDVLKDNGGFTQTHALQAGSSAIDAGDPENCPPADQRGVSRPMDGDGDGNARCDMGSYEFIPSIYLPLVLK